VDIAEQQAFDLGWDYAAFGVDVPEKATKLFCDGYRAFASDRKRRPQRPDRYTRKWLQIRLNAFARDKLFSAEVTPQFIEQITPSSGRCPIIEKAFTYGEGKPTDWSIDRANNDRGYVPGNIIVISQHANSAKSDKLLNEIEALAHGEVEEDGLSPTEWRRLAQRIKPAFGDQFDDVDPVHILVGQPLALGMPISPLASFQVTLSRAIIAGWDVRSRDNNYDLIALIESLICHTKVQRRHYRKLTQEIIRRAKHIYTYWEIWATPRIQKRLFSLVNSLDGPGLARLAELQEITVGKHNRKIA
jgi:hypothetical protein